jgi:hypothetical protein
MYDKLIFEVAVEFDPTQISQLKSPAGEVLMIPFGGTVKGELFNGRVLPGGVDTQTVDQNGVRHMSARYMLEGVDKNRLKQSQPSSPIAKHLRRTSTAISSAPKDILARVE